MSKQGHFIKGSLKQLLHTPMKTALFFLLIMAVSLLLVFSGALLSQTAERIAAAENEFVTLGTVEQVRDSNETRPLWNSCLKENEDIIEMLDISTYQELLGPEVLDFDGADYVQEPETRPYYIAYMPDYGISSPHGNGYEAVAEFTVLEQIDDKRFMIRLERTLYKAAEGSPRIMEMFSEGSEVPMCTHNQPVHQAFEAGRRYIGMLKFDQYSEEGVWDAEYLVLFTSPFSTQVDADTHLAVEKGTVPMTNNLYYEDGGWSYIEESFTTTSKFSETVCADEVTDGFYDEGGRGQIWLNWAEGLEQVTKLEKHFTVIPTNSLDLLPVFHDRSAMLTEGRAITDGEFASGARVCLVSKGFLGINGLYIGDKLPLSLVYSMYGQCWKWDSGDGFGGTFSPLNAEGELYEPFWEAEYEIVGTYDMPFNDEFKYCLDTGKGIKGDSIIIPAKSVEASDENNIAYYAPMNAWTTSFIIPNGTIEEFDKRLHEAVPEASKLVITYDDSGYGEVKESLNNARLSGLLLFLVALLAAMAVIVLLLYFFVVKEKKRTAIERSLGMTRNQCRVSLVSGIVMIALTASLLGSIAGAVLVEKADFSVGEQEEFDSEYSLEYSMWAKNQDAAELDVEVSTPWAVYTAAPLALTAVILLLSVGMVNRSLKIEPIYLLSSKEE